MREVQDHYFREAKREGYLSRAAYKLIEIDDRKKILRKGDYVLDCGAAPGSWLQVAARRVGPTGIVVGIDLQAIRHRFSEPHIRIIEGDITITSSEELLRFASEPARHRAGASSTSAVSHHRLFNIILSDMAPSTSGDPAGDHHRSVRLCHTLLDRCPILLQPGGNLVMKVFEGEAYPDLLNRTANMFSSARGFKPKASRTESAEMYIVATNFKAREKGVVSLLSGDDAGSPAISKPKPSKGWIRR